MRISLGCALLLLGVFPVSCKIDLPAGDDYLIFGTAYGECAGDCATLYLVQHGKVYADKEDWYTYQRATLPAFSRASLPDSNYLQAVGLDEAFPEYLLNHPDTIIGCPDCVDQGGVHLILKRGGKRYDWHIDNAASQQPAEIQAYMAQVRTVMGRLR